MTSDGCAPTSGTIELVVIALDGGVATLSARSTQIVKLTLTTAVVRAQ